MDKYAALKQYFGYGEFRPGQAQLIDGVLSGRDVFGIMPTGGGKSLCYQIPALLLPGITLVISPLISLMRDQVLALKAAGVPAAYINSTLSSGQMQAVYRNLRAGMYKIVYVAPERLDYSGFTNLANTLHISFIAVDEAHCISQWGQDFRPSYLRIVHFVAALSHRPVLGAYTATATTQVREDVERILKLREPVRSITGFDRPNLFFEVEKSSRKDSVLLQLMAKRKRKSGIIYCATRKNVESVCALLESKGYSATRYHAGLDEQERSENQEDFLYDRKTVMVATNAFGMGIDKSNVSFVIHYNMPKSIEAYYQEAGRAGRDGAEAECILLYNTSDVRTARFLIENSSDNEELDELQREQVRKKDLQRLELMVAYCKTKGCLRGYILDYFGQKHPQICGNCGNCKGDFELRDITREAQMILSCIHRVQDYLGYCVGSTMIAKVLQGSKAKRILEQRLNTLSTYGLLKTMGRKQICNLIDHLEAEGYLLSEQEHQTICLTPKAALVLYRGETVQIRVRKEEVSADTTGRASGEDTELYEILRELRAELAHKANVPAYVIFSNATLMDMAKKCPQTIAEFRRVSGVGELKAGWYGSAFLERIKKYLDEQ